MLRHKLPIITPDLPIPARSPNLIVQPEFLNPKFLYKTEKTSRVLTAERMNHIQIKACKGDDCNRTRGLSLRLSCACRQFIVLASPAPRMHRTLSRCVPKGRLHDTRFHAHTLILVNRNLVNLIVSFGHDSSY